MIDSLIKEINSNGGLVDMSHNISAPLYAIRRTKRILNAAETKSLDKTRFVKIGIEHSRERIQISSNWSASFYGYIYKVE